VNTLHVFGYNILEIIGLFGVAFYLGSYAALQTGFIRGSSYQYAILNAIAASLVLVSLIKDFNLSSAIIQISWIAISITGMIRLYYVRNGISFSHSEQEFLDTKLPDVENDTAARFFTSGEWLQLEKGSQIMIEGKPIEYLYYLESGLANVSSTGMAIAAIGAKNYVGEVTCFTGKPATASVMLEENSRVFRIPVTGLRKIAPNGSTLRHAIERSIADDLRQKLTSQNLENSKR
jgi:hypothetical protein